MAMLAEPRRKKRSLNLRGKNHWSEDQNKFGIKLMEKMGWTQGKGLGAKEDGNVEHLKVRFKDDSGGVGFKDFNNQWTEHETHFETLLKNLHGGNVKTDKLHSECSLEEKSKKLQSRLHYKKFTRGKDVTKYSHKDLANIFGKKTLNKQPAEEIQVEVESAKDEEAVVVPNLNLVEGGCMKEYFKLKMSNVKGTGCKEEKSTIIYEEEDSIVAFRGFACDGEKTDTDKSDKAVDVEPTTKQKSKFNMYPCFQKASDNIISSDDSSKKKNKKKRKLDEFQEEDKDEVLIVEDNNNDELNGKIKKKAKKIKFVIEEKLNHVEKTTSNGVQADLERKSNKKKNCKELCNAEEQLVNKEVCEEIVLSDESVKCVEQSAEEIVRKKKNKKNKKQNLVDNQQKNSEVNHEHSLRNSKPYSEDVVEILDGKQPLKKKKPEADVIEVDEVILTKKKKKKSKNDAENFENEDLDHSSSMPSSNDTIFNPKIKVTKSKRKKQTYKPLILGDGRRLRSSSYSQVVQQCLPDTDVNIVDSITSTRKLIKKPVDLTDASDVQSKCKTLKEQLKATVKIINDVEMKDVSNVRLENNLINAPGPSQSALNSISISSFPTVLSSQTASNSWELLSLKKMLDDPFVSATRKQYINQRILQLNDVIIKELLLSTQHTSKSEEIVLLENLCSMLDTQNLSPEQKLQLECVLVALREKVINEVMKEVSNVNLDYDKVIADLQSLFGLKCLTTEERENIMKTVCNVREAAAKNLIKQTHAPVDDNVKLLEKVNAMMNDPFLPAESKTKILHKIRYFKNKTINKLTNQQINNSESDSSLTIKLQTLLQDPNIPYNKRLRIIDKIKKLEASATEIFRSCKYELKEKLTYAMTDVLCFVGTNLQSISGYGVDVKHKRVIEILQPDVS